MTSEVRRLGWLPLLVCAALILAACGSSSATGHPGTHPDRTPGSTTSTTKASSPTSTAPAHPGFIYFGNPTAVSKGVALESVSCGSPTFCVALDSSGAAFVFNGSAWSGPDAIGGQPIGPGAISVSCSNPQYCMADATGGDQMVSWNGQAWSAPVTIEGANGLEAVGCAPSGYCATVDAEGNAFAFTGGSWTGTSGDWGSVSSISCVSASFCISTSGGISQWNGGAWSQPASFGDPASFAGVSCPTTSFCTAVDQSGGVVQWNGLSWSARTPIEPATGATAVGITPTSVSCPTGTFCAVADASGGVVEWASGSWIRQDVDGSHHLTSISCPTATFCAAVDQSGDAVVTR